ASDGDCTAHGSIGTPTPFAQGTQMHCLAEPLIGVQGYCWPGSGDPCDGAASACPPGEACGVWFYDRLPDGGPAPDQLHGRCIAAYATPKQAQTGERCDIEDPYQCADPVGLFHNCLGGACTQGCNTTVTGTCPANTQCFGPLAVELRSTGQVLE